MDRLTRRQIEQHCLVLRDALGEIFPSLDDPSREYYWELLDEVGKMALQSLSQEAVRDEALEEAAKIVWDGTEGPSITWLDSLTGRPAFDPIQNARITLANRIRALKREPNAAGQALPEGQREVLGATSGGNQGSAPAAPVAEMVNTPEGIANVALPVFSNERRVRNGFRNPERRKDKL